MTRPNFLIIGAAKCATTSLASLLDAHPEALIVKGKEPHFFSYDQRYQQGLEAYEARFDHYNGEIAVGDASTSYSRIRQHPQVIERIKANLHLPKIIYMVRHPIERIESAYIEQMTESHNNHIASINEAVQQIPMMIDSSRYWETYAAYRRAFGEKQMHVIWFEEYKADLSRVFKEACKFLNIDSEIPPNLEQVRSNSRKSSQSRIDQHVSLDTKWDKTVLKRIRKSLKKDNERFLIQFKRPLSYWS